MTASWDICTGAVGTFITVCMHTTERKRLILINVKDGKFIAKQTCKSYILREGGGNSSSWVVVIAGWLEGFQGMA